MSSAPAASTNPADRPVVTLAQGRDARLRRGHPWVYSNEVTMDAAAKALPAGTVVRLQGADGRARGTAMFNPHTLIAARVLHADPGLRVDRAFWRKRLSAAIALRDRLIGTPFYRLAHGEADGLPGLIVDRYGDVLAVQVNSAGMALALDDIVAVLQELLSPRAIVLKGDSAARKQEGLAEEIRLLAGTLDGPVEGEENGTVFIADLLEGQKTGWFYDQRDNRAFMAGLCAGARVIDAYAHTGGFGLQAAKGGAASVEAIDRSGLSLGFAERAAERNGVAGRFTATKADVFDLFERRGAEGERYDVVIVDPPAFAKSKKDVGPATRAYRKLARLSARLVTPGGFLMLASCSHNVEADTFLENSIRGIGDADRTGRLLRQAGAGPDHPVHPQLPESAYLKAIVLQLD